MPRCKGPGRVMKNSTSFQTNTLETIKTQKQGGRRTERKGRKTDGRAGRKNKHLAPLGAPRSQTSDVDIKGHGRPRARAAQGFAAN